MGSTGLKGDSVELNPQSDKPMMLTIVISTASSACPQIISHKFTTDDCHWLLGRRDEELWEYRQAPEDVSNFPSTRR